MVSKKTGIRLVFSLGLIIAGLAFSWLFSSQPVSQAATVRKIHVPYFNNDTIDPTHFDETSIFWYGSVSSNTAYTDVRLGYNSTELYVYMAVIDRYLWTDGDGLSLYVSSDDPAGGMTNSYRFDTKLSINMTEQKQAYKYISSSWQSVAASFTTLTGWRGDGYNNNANAKGWTMAYHIPFSSLGFAQPPDQGTIWRLGVVTHNKNTASGTPSIPDSYWPETFNATDLSSWGQLIFGPAPAAPVTVTNQQTLTIKNRLNGVSAYDVEVGGSSVCGGAVDYWTQWGNLSWWQNGQNGGFTVQNQSDISDYPCFSKVYMYFPLSLPAGKGIVSATLTLYEFGSSTTPNYPSYIQVHRLAEDFDPATVTWNNGPKSLENFATTKVNPTVFPGNWTSLPVYQWDLTALVRQAYQESTPLRLALYDSDSNYHSGKTFVSSETQDWNAANRPTITIVYGDASPTAPSNLTATQVSKSQINLGWKDNAVNETGFRIERDINNAGSWSQAGQVGANITSFQDQSGISELTTYSYRIIAFNASGDSGSSNTASVSTPVIAPDNLVATTISATEIDLSWRNNSSVQAGFKIERKDAVANSAWSEINSITSSAGPGVTVNYNDTTVSAGKLYYYRVRAYQGANLSGYSNQGSGMTPVAGSCNVSSGADSGANTLREALSNPACSTISISVGQINLTTTALPVVNRSLVIGGSCGANGPGAVILGTGLAGPGLALASSGNYIFGLKIAGFIGNQLQVTPGSGNNRVYCVKTSRL